VSHPSLRRVPFVLAALLAAAPAPVAAPVAAQGPEPPFDLHEIPGVAGKTLGRTVSGYFNAVRQRELLSGCQFGFHALPGG